MPKLTLPTATGSLAPYTMGPAAEFPRTGGPFNRQAVAAMHVVADARAAADPSLDDPVDWGATLALRERVWDLGLGVAEAMDTAQRGMGLSVERAMELNRRSLASAKARTDTPLLYCGVGTDALSDETPHSLDAIIAAYEAQVEAIEAEGGQVVLMASRALATTARGPDDYAKVYDRVLSQLSRPCILHWLGEVFDPALQGYWGAPDHWQAMDVTLDIIARHQECIAGIKLSLLDKEKEIALRNRLPPGVAMFTGDDFNYVELIEGDGDHASDALLGAFDMLAPAASAALTQLAQGDIEGWRRRLEPTVPLARHIFAAPTRFYKTGVVFLAWLYGWQPHFVMVGGQQSARSISHFTEAFRLADQAQLFADPDLAAARMAALLETHGISQ